jgi:predicted SAM-dependent methyltransferase
MLGGMLKNLLSDKAKTADAGVQVPKATSTSKISYNMGCGHNKLDGFVNIDAFAECAPDLVIDLETLPWPLETSSADLVVFNHSLEHMGQDPNIFIGIMKELYRICKPGAEIQINVPHPRHNNFIDDPTHVRAITPAMLALFDREKNDEWKRLGYSNTPMAHYTGVNFKTIETYTVLSNTYLQLYQRKEISEEELNRFIEERNNVVEEYRIILTAIKP